MPRLSVITPALDQVRYIGETLDSVARLRFDHEHIVIDGGSTDGTVELLRQRDDPRLIWISEPDRGQTDAVNKGLRRARGDYIGWINADDTYVAEGVAQAIHHLEAHPDVGAVYGTFAGAILLVAWLWLTNVALLFGAELNAEIERERELREGVPHQETLNRPARGG